MIAKCRNCKRDYGSFEGNFGINNKSSTKFTLDCNKCRKKHFKQWERTILNARSKHPKKVNDRLTQKEINKQLTILKSLSDKHTWQPEEYYLADIKFCEY